MLVSEVRHEASLHPLLALAAALPVFLAGIPLVGTPYGWAYPVVIALVYAVFGYGRAWLKANLYGLPVIIIAASLTCITMSPQRALLHGLRAYLLLMASVLTLTIEPIRLVRVLHSLHFPRLLSLGLLITLRFFSVLASEMRRIRLALKSRGVSSLSSRPSLVFRAWLMPLLIRLFSLTDTLSLSLETRGFHPQGEATCYESVPWRRRDSLFCGVLLLLAGGGLFLV